MKSSERNVFARGAFGRWLTRRAAFSAPVMEKMNERVHAAVGDIWVN
jgi:hypothetical protein